MSEQHDWADDLAHEIITEYRKYGDQPGFPIMLASRLRIVRIEGHTEGFNEAFDRAKTILDSTLPQKLSIVQGGKS